MPTCTGTGDGGGHCCWINGEVCEFLNTSGPIPRCGIWDTMNTGKWRKAPVGKWFATNHPGFTCQDWPQNIPTVLNRPGANLCCWNS